MSAELMCSVNDPVESGLGRHCSAWHVAPALNEWIANTRSHVWTLIYSNMGEQSGWRGSEVRQKGHYDPKVEEKQSLFVPPPGAIVWPFIQRGTIMQSLRLQTCIYAGASSTHGATCYPTCHAQTTSHRSQEPLSLKHEDGCLALKYRWFILPFPPATCLDRHLLRQTKLTETNSEHATWIQMGSKENNCSLVNGCGWVIYLCLWVCICSL